jgi:hypothetical protein
LEHNVVLKQLAAWRILHELMKICGDNDVLPVLIKPCSGQYACLSLVHYAKRASISIIQINLNGSSVKIAGGRLMQYSKKIIGEFVCAAKPCIANVLDVPRILPGFIFFEQLLKDNVKNEIRICNAWDEDDYGGFLLEAAHRFPYYPQKKEADMDQHLPWWVIVVGSNAVGICDVMQGKLIDKEGLVYDLASEAEMACKQMNQFIKIQEYYNLIAEASYYFETYKEWAQQYACIGEEMVAKREKIYQTRKFFELFSPLKLNIVISKFSQTNRAVNYELRYLGQTVADIAYTKGSMWLVIYPYEESNYRDFGFGARLHRVMLKSEQAIQFSQYFKSRPKVKNAASTIADQKYYLTGRLLKKLSAKNVSENGFYIEAIKIEGTRFPMVLPAETERYYFNIPLEIDVLCRLRDAQLGEELGVCIVVGKWDKDDVGKQAIKHVLVQVVFIRQLLRSPAGEKWWRLFGFKGPLPEQITINAVIFAPYTKKSAPSFSGVECAVGNDTIKLGHISYVEDEKVVRIVDSSFSACRD